MFSSGKKKTLVCAGEEISNEFASYLSVLGERTFTLKMLDHFTEGLRLEEDLVSRILNFVSVQKLTNRI